MFVGGYVLKFKSNMACYEIVKINQYLFKFLLVISIF